MNTVVVTALLYGLLIQQPTTIGIVTPDVVTLAEFAENIENYVVQPEEQTPLKTPKKRRISLTAYWTNDGTGSGACTGSGLCTSDFDISPQGWYTYNGYVVVAGATNVCLGLKKGVCSEYNELPPGYTSHDFGDIITFDYANVKYDGIILDTCGASFWDEGQQRYDIFVASAAHSIGKRSATIWE